MNETEYWMWLESEVESQLKNPKNVFLTIHPARIRVEACKVFGLRGITEFWTWQKTHHKQLEAAFRKAGRKLNLRLLPPSVTRSYTTFARIDGPSNRLLTGAR